MQRALDFQGTMLRIKEKLEPYFCGTLKYLEGPSQEWIERINPDDFLTEPTYVLVNTWTRWARRRKWFFFSCWVEITEVRPIVEIIALYNGDINITIFAEASRDIIEPELVHLCGALPEENEWRSHHASLSGWKLRSLALSWR